MTVRAEAFLAIESSVANRLLAAWQKVSAYYRKEAQALIAEKRWAEAYQLAGSIDLTHIVPGNREYLRYASYSALLFGASRLTDDLKQSIITRGNGQFNEVIDAAVEQMGAAFTYNLAEQVRRELLEEIHAQQIADAQTNFGVSEKFLVQKEDLLPYNWPDEATKVEPLYVRRDVVNAQEIVNWAKMSGFETTVPPEDLHVTVVYSRTPVSWGGFDQDHDGIFIQGGERELTPLGDGGAIVLKFECNQLHSRWQQFIDWGASWDYESYQPHITITFQGPDEQALAKIAAYTGPIELGPEIFEPLTLDWKKEIVEKYSKDQPREPKGSPIGGQFAKSFNAWFGDSKVVDSEGNPLVVYHGTGATNIESFRGDSGAAWFSENVNHANEYASAYYPYESKGQYPVLYPAYLKVSKPLKLSIPMNTKVTFEQLRKESGLDFNTPKYMSEGYEDAGTVYKQKYLAWQIVNTKEFVDAAEKAGYDGIFALEGSAKTWAVFNQSSIKSSIGNRGTFDPNEVSILKYDPNQPREPKGSPIGGQFAKSFQAWFEGSKVVNDDGTPRVVYHGSTDDFSEFNTDGGNKGYGLLNTLIGSHFAEDPDVTDAFTIGTYRQTYHSDPNNILVLVDEKSKAVEAYDEKRHGGTWGIRDRLGADLTAVRGGGQVYPVYLNIKNPLIVEHTEGEFDQTSIAKAVSKLVFPRSKELFTRVFQNIGYSEEVAIDVWDTLSKGGTYRLGSYAQEFSSFDYIADNWSSLIGNPRDVLEAKSILKSLGYDGIKYVNTSRNEVRPEDSGVAWIAFEPEQIKSAIGNVGTFDPKSKHILKYDPDQPREPKGSPIGGQFAKKPSGAGNGTTTGTEEGSVSDGRRISGSTSGMETSGRPHLADDEPLKGLPRNITIPGQGEVLAGPNPAIRKIAREYMQKAGLPYDPPQEYVKVDPERAKKIAAAFDEMKHDPQNPEVKAAYETLAKETVAQYEAALAAGLKVEFIDYAKDGDPYAASPRLMTEDVNKNNHMWVFSTADGFGSSEMDVSDNPLLAETKFKISGKTARLNDLFRVVHDFFGHVKEGVGFRADGEENAWRAHSSMFSPEARKALTTETRGQNSWVNYGPHGEKNRTASGGDTVFADQKVGILPQWVIEDGAKDIVRKWGSRLFKSNPYREPAGAPNSAGGQYAKGPNLPLVEFGKFKTGQPVSFEYTRNLEKSPKPGPEDTFAQRIEPAGRYLLENTAGDKVPPGLERGTVGFRSPLVMDFGDSSYSSPSNWKRVLSAAYKGKTGKALTRALLQDGFDGVVTVQNYKGTLYTSEIVDLTVVRKENPYHEPAGSPGGIGGQFAKKPGVVDLPPVPGTTPIPEGYVRLYHQTGEKEALAIGREGIAFSHAKGIEGPRAIYAGEDGFYQKLQNEHFGDTPTVEFAIPKERWESPFVVGGDVEPKDIIAVHLPWHYQARYLEERDKIQETLEGKFDFLLKGNEVHDDAARAVLYIKEKYQQVVQKDNPYHEPAGSPGGIGGQFAKKPPITQELVGASGGQLDLVLRQGDKGTLSYSDYHGEVTINMIDVKEKRQGIGTSLVRELQRLYPDKEISWGVTTPEGTKLRESLEYEDVPISGYKEKQEVLTSLTKDLEVALSIGDFDKANEIRDRRDDLEKELSGYKGFVRVLKENPYREPAGAPQGKGGQYARAPTRRTQLASILERLGKPDGGFTYHIVTGNEPKEGFAVSPYPTRSFAIEGNKLTLDHLVDYVRKNRDILRRSNHYLGGWHDPESGKIFLDVSIVSKTPKKAEVLAREYDQIAYFDLGKGVSVTVNPDATSGGVVNKGDFDGEGTETSFSSYGGWGQYDLRQLSGPFSFLDGKGAHPGGIGECEEEVGRAFKADRVVRPFVSFDTKGTNLVQLIANLHTSRLSAYGFTAEADVLGVDSYAISAQLDNRICPVCAEMHGKTFDVGDARQLLDIVLRETDPNTLKILQPWPKQDEATVADIKSMSREDITERGWHIPPYHPNCRCLLVHVNKVPKIQDTASYRAAFSSQPGDKVSSPEDFGSYGLVPTEKNLQLWNSYVKMGPGDFLSSTLGRDPQELMDLAKKGRKVNLGLTFDPNHPSVGVDFNTVAFGSSRPVRGSFRMDFLNKVGEIKQAHIHQDDQTKGLPKRIFKSWTDMFKRVGLKQATLDVVPGTGSYAYAKYGMVPTQSSWSRLRTKILNDKTFLQKLLPDIKEVVEGILSSDDPRNVWLLSDVRDQNGQLIGRNLLSATDWSAVLEFEDPLAMSRFDLYIGS